MLPSAFTVPFVALTSVTDVLSNATVCFVPLISAEPPAKFKVVDLPSELLAAS